MQHPRESAFALDKTLHAAQAVVRRRFAFEYLRLLGLALAAAAIASLLLVLFAKWSMPDLLTWRPFALFGLLALVVPAWVAARSKWSRDRAARELDRSLRHQDVFSSALELSRNARSHELAFIHELARRAESAAANADTSKSLRLSFGPAWTLWPVFLLIAIAAAWLVPERSKVAEAQAKKRAEEVRETAAELRTLAQSIPAPVKPQASSDSIDAPHADEAITALERELSEGKITSHEARMRAAEELNKKSAELEKRAQAQQRSIDEAKNALAKAAARSSRDQHANPQAARIAEALRTGDVASAADEISKLAESEQNLSPAERSAAAKEMQKIADALEPLTSKGSDKENLTPAESIRDAARDAAQNLREQAHHEQPESLQSPSTSSETNPQQPQQPNKNESTQSVKPGASSKPNPPQDSTQNNQSRENPQTSPKTQESPPDQNRQPASSGRQQQQSNQPNEQSSRQQGEKPSIQPDNQPSQQDNSQRQTQSEKKDQKGSEPGKQPGQSPEASQRTPGQSPSQSPGQSPPPRDNAKSESKNENQDSKQGTNQEQRVTENSQGREDSSRPRQPGENPQAPSQRQSQDSAEDQTQQSDPKSASQKNQPDNQQGTQQQNQPSPGQSQGQQRDSAASPRQVQQPAPSDANTNQNQPGAQPGTPSDTRQQTRPGNSRTAKESLDQLARELKNVSRQNDGAKRNQETARGLRDRAEQLMESASPEDRARMNELAKQLARSDSLPAKDAYPEWRGPTQVFDTRATEQPSQSPDSPPDRTIAEWLSEPKPGGKGASGGLPAEPLRKATEGAQQAIEQQAIPPKYTDLVKRVFKRYSDSTSGGTSK